MPRKHGLDKPRVVSAAADLVNTEGLESLSLGRLAVILGVQTPSLYNHVDGLPGLLRELAVLGTRQLNECIASAAVGKSGEQAVMAVAQAYRSYIKHNPGVYQSTLRSSANVQPLDPDLEAAQEQLVKVCLAVLAGFRLEGKEALHALRALRSLVHGFTTLELAGGFGLPLDCDESFRRMMENYVQDLERAEAVSPSPGKM